jgi:site-specific DNA-methyltransferase (adenine-specific)
MPRRRPTTTSKFGVSRRESHDASDFYARFTAPELSDGDEIAEPWQLDEIFCGDARTMDKVAPNSVALVVTSPPYFAGKEYEQALGEGHVPATYLDYLHMLESVFEECVRALEPGGRIAVNVANLGRKPYRSLAADVITILQDRLRLLLRGEVIWQKARGAAGNCAWGSFQSPANPVLRDLSERVIIASKGRFDRVPDGRTRANDRRPHLASISKDEFMEATTDIWEIASESARRVGHPAPFPVELPERLIQLYTYVDDLVLDPFMGSGATAVAAIRTGRHFVGYDTDESYVERARQRAALERERDGGPPRSAGDPALKELARTALEESGFSGLEGDLKLPQGVEVSFRAHDRAGGTWFVDVAGALTTSRPGLKRADVLWKAIGKAAVLHEAYRGTRLLLVTAGMPTGPAAAALDAVCGPAKPVFDVVDLGAPADLERLRQYAAGDTS